MASEFTRSWEAIRREKPLNEARVATYRRLMSAQERIAQARHRRGESWAKIEAALAAGELSDSEVDEVDDIYLCAMSRYVAALGGQLEVRAVFPDEAISLRYEPSDPGGSGSA